MSGDIVESVNGTAGDEASISDTIKAAATGSTLTFVVKRPADGVLGTGTMIPPGGEGTGSGYRGKSAGRHKNVLDTHAHLFDPSHDDHHHAMLHGSDDPDDRELAHVMKQMDGMVRRGRGAVGPSDRRLDL